MVDPKLAARITVETLREKKLLRGAIIAMQAAEDYVVLWPENFSGSFELL